MNETRTSGKLTAGDRLTAAMLRWSPWLAYLLVALPLPLYLWLTRAGTDDAVVALFSFVASSVAGLVVAFILLLYRRRWERGLRERLAADGVTADELSFFMSELTADERRALKRMESQSLLLADAYRQTLAARVTGTRVIAAARREASALEDRLQNASRLEGAGRRSLEAELSADRERLARVEREAAAHQAEIESRLQMIEALASRGASQEETELALQRLGAAREFAPLSMAAMQTEFEAEKELVADMNAETDSTPRKLEASNPE